MLELAAWASALGVGATVSILVRWLVNRSVAKAEVESITVSTATEVVALVSSQLDSLQQQLDAERDARHRTEGALRERIGMLEEHVALLSRGIEQLGGDPRSVLDAER